MFTAGILIGIYTYIVFALGMLGWLYKNTIIIASILYILVILFYFHRSSRMKISISKDINGFVKKLWKNKLFFLFIILFFSQVLINFIGVLGPELAFDALWYHLTFPKIYLLNHAIMHIPGGLLYYSDMPKLGEMLYTASLAISNETGAKIIHFSFGLLTCIAIYKFSRKYFSSFIATIAVVIFYSNLVVAWQSITAYVDLVRTFFEVMALWGFINWTETKKRIWIIESATMAGLAVSVKLLALGSLIIFIFLLIFHGLSNKESLRIIFKNVLLYSFIALLIPLPWFIFSFIHTGSPIYPFFTNIYKVGIDLALFSPIYFVSEIWILFIQLADPISPIYILLLPLIIIFFRKFSPSLKIILVYSLISIIIWYFTPRTGGGRFILPYLPAFSLLAAAVIYYAQSKIIQSILISLVIVVSIISIIYRGIANSRYIPVIIGAISKQEFLSTNLNFAFGDFYDVDGYFAKNIKEGDRVLLYGFHNFYYVNFPFVDSSWVKKGDKFNYIAVQNGALPKRFKFWNLVYYNENTHVRLYSIGGLKWVY